MAIKPDKLGEELGRAHRSVAETLADYEAAVEERKRLILEAVDAGNSKRQIALELGLATQRVQQIVDRAAGRG